MLYLDKIIGQSSLPKVYIGIGGIVLDNTVFLNTNREMPLLGLGVYKATGENEAENAIISAVESGYRLIDTASGRSALPCVIFPSVLPCRTERLQLCSTT